MGTFAWSAVKVCAVVTLGTDLMSYFLIFSKNMYSFCFNASIFLYKTVIDFHNLEMVFKNHN